MASIRRTNILSFVAGFVVGLVAALAAAVALTFLAFPRFVAGVVMAYTEILFAPPVKKE